MTDLFRFPRRALDAQLAGFTCPRCGMASYHPTDREEGYCGACHDWTGSGDALTEARRHHETHHAATDTREDAR